MTVLGGQAVRPTVGLTAKLRFMVPAKLNLAVRVPDNDAPAPELKSTGVPTVIVKSPTWTVTLAECEAEPGVPAALMVTP